MPLPTEVTETSKEMTHSRENESRVVTAVITGLSPDTSVQCFVLTMRLQKGEVFVNKVRVPYCTWKRPEYDSKKPEGRPTRRIIENNTVNCKSCIILNFRIIIQFHHIRRFRRSKTGTIWLPGRLPVAVAGVLGVRHWKQTK